MLFIHNFINKLFFSLTSIKVILGLFIYMAILQYIQLDCLLFIILISPSSNLDSHYVSGFADGESCFLLVLVLILN